MLCPTRLPHICCTAGEVIKPDTFKCIAEEGMPFHGRPFQKGNLYIHFQVVFPDRIDPKIVSVPWCFVCQSVMVILMWLRSFLLDVVLCVLNCC